MADVSGFLRLLLGTIIYRPYVYAFFLYFLVSATRVLRPRGCALYVILAYLIAFGCEYSSTRNGFPFGIYTYHDATRERELWISNVPFWDSLSFVFLSYFSWMLAGSLRREPKTRGALMRPTTALLAGLLMMLLDVVIDPVTLLGDRWFLGEIYEYPSGGSYFGVTLANFAGWLVVGGAIPLAYQSLARLRLFHFSRWREPSLPEQKRVFATYVAVFLFNLGITAWVAPRPLLLASSLITTLTIAGCYVGLRRRRAA